MKPIAHMIPVLFAIGCTIKPPAPEKPSCSPFQTEDATHTCVCQKNDVLYSPKGDVSENSWARSPDGSLEAGWTDEGYLAVRKTSNQAVLWKDAWQSSRKFLVWHPDGDVFFTGEHYARNHENELSREQTDIKVNTALFRSSQAIGTLKGYIHMAFFEPDTDTFVYGADCWYHNPDQHVTLTPEGIERSYD